MTSVFERLLATCDRVVPRTFAVGSPRRVRARSLIFFVVAMAGFALFAATGWCLAARYVEALITLGAFGGLLVVPVVLHQTRRVGPAVDALNTLFVLGIAVQAALSGGSQSMLLPYLALVPVVTVTFSDGRRGAQWSGVCLLMALAFVGADLAGYTFPVLFDGFATNANQAICASLFVALTATVSALYRHEQTHADDSLRAHVDELRRANAELEATREAAVTSNEAKEAFLANVSHEMRTPLAAILGLSELMREEELGPVARTYLDEVSHSGRALLHIIDDLLDAVRARSHELSLQYKAFDLRDLCEDARAAVAGSAWRKNVELSMHLDRTAEGRFHGDPGRLRQILVNLLNNSVKFTEEGSVSLHVRRDDDKMLRFEVRDTGIGMPEEALSKVFERFEQADQGRARKFGGTGLGLAISRDLVERMGGRIGVASKVGEGSVFWFELPLSRLGAATMEPVWAGNVAVRIQEGALHRELVDHLGALGATVVDDPRDPTAIAVFTDERWVDEVDSGSQLFVVIPMGRSSVELPPTAVRMMSPIRRSALRELLAGVCNTTPEVEKSLTGDARGRVLVVDDHAVNRMVARRLIEKMGWEVDEAHDGPTAVHMAMTVPYNLVLMDCQMPGMDGYDATRAIRRNEATLPVVALTAGALAKDRERAIESGMCDVLTKPIEPERLQATLERFEVRALTVV